MINKPIVLTIFLLLLPSFAFTQTAAELDTLLETKTVTVQLMARFILGSAELLPQGLYGDTAQTAAYEMALSNGWTKKSATDFATLKDTAFLIMNVFDFKGGLFYSIFQSPRYAYRELLYKRIIQGRSDPSMTVSGDRLLQIIGRALTFSGENELMELLILGDGGIN